LAESFDLTAAWPEVQSFVEGVVARPDGGAYVVLRDDDHTEQRLITVVPDGESYAVAESVTMPAMADEPGLWVLDDGRVLVAGQFRSDSQGGPGDEPDYGFQVIDPETGDVETTVVAPFADHTEYSYQLTALSPDQQTLYLYVSYSLFDSTDPDERDSNEMFAVDVSSGEVETSRELGDDLAGISVYDSGVYASALLARPGGGVALVFDLTPSETDDDVQVPSVLFYGADLEIDGAPVELTDGADDAEADVATATPDGTVLVAVSGFGGHPLLAVPDGGDAGSELVDVPANVGTFGLVVEPAAEWALVYYDSEVRPLQLTTGELGDELPLECGGDTDVRQLVPGPGGVGAVIVTECDDDARTQLLWFATP
jgi:hypothetical protein